MYNQTVFMWESLEPLLVFDLRKGDVMEVLSREDDLLHPLNPVKMCLHLWLLSKMWSPSWP